MPEEVETSWRGKVGGMTEEEMERFLEYGVVPEGARLKTA